jgi:hypothetical protein
MTQALLVPATVALRAVYRAFHAALPWPRPIPSCDDVHLEWISAQSRVFGRCRPVTRSIAINHIFRDPRLSSELGELMAHEMAHFLWPNHSREFKTFLRRSGVSEAYVHGRCQPSPMLWRVLMEREPASYIWQCQDCRAVIDTGFPIVASCGRCAPRWDRRYVLKQICLQEITGPIRLTTLRLRHDQFTKTN